MALTQYNRLGMIASALYRDLIRDPHLVGLWVLNEAGGGTFYDRCTLNVLPATVSGSPTYSVALGNGHYGCTLAAASSQYASLSTPSSLAFLDATAHAAVSVLKVSNTAAIKTIISRRSNAGNTPGWEFRFAADETLEYVMCDDSGGQDRVGSDAALATATLVMPGFSKSGAGAAAVTLYSGGTAVADTDDANACAGDPTYTGINASLGARNNADQFFDGTLGMTAVFSAAKTAADFRRWAVLGGFL